MAIAFTKLTEWDTTSFSAGAFTTASVTLGANELGIVVCALRATANPTGGAVVSVTSSHGTWVKASEQASGSGSNRLLATFRTMGSGATGTVTVQGPSDILGMTGTVIKVTGIDTTGTNGSGAFNSQSPIAVDFGNSTDNGQPHVTITGTNPSAGDVTWAAMGGDDAETGLTQDAGWTNITQLTGTNEDCHSVMYSTGIDVTATWSGVRAGRAWSTAGVVIKLDTGGGDTLMAQGVM